MNKIISTILFIAGLILIGMSVYYIVQIVRLSLWEDVIFRIVSVLAFIGSGVFIGFSQVLKNQQKVIESLQELKKEEKE